MIFIRLYHYLFLFLYVAILLYYFVVCKCRLKDAIKLIIVFGFCICSDYRFFGFSLAQLLMMAAFILGISWNNYGRITLHSGGKIRNRILLYTIYMSMITVIGYLAGRGYKVKGSIIQNELRPVMQILQFLVLMYAVAYTLALNREESLEIIEFLNKALVFVAIMGVIQWTLYYFVKIDIFPLVRDGRGVTSRTAHGFARATSFVGEPKQFAKFMCIGICLELFCLRNRIRGKINIRRLLLFSVCILMTASATGAIIAAAVYGLYFVMKAKKRGLLLIGILIFLIMAAFAIRLPFVSQKVAYTAEMGGEIPFLENCDTAVVRWLMAEPQYGIFGVGMANTVCYAHDYVPSGSPWIANYIFTLRRGIILYMAEGGIFGTLMVLSVFIGFIRRTGRNTIYRYGLIFLILMNLFLTAEAINGLQFLLMALVSNVGCEEKVDEREQNFIQLLYPV